MAIRIVQLGSPRAVDEGLRLGTVRRPPRGVPKQDFAKRDFYDFWLPVLSPSLSLMQQARAVALARDAQGWDLFERTFLKELSDSHGMQTLDLLAVMSHQTHFSLGCYCDDADWCHRAVLRRLLTQRAAQLRV